MRKLVTALLVLLFLQLSQTAFAQERTIIGTITSPDDAPIVGASIIIKGKTTGTQTDQNGKFTISAIPRDVLTISAVGFTTREIKVGNSSTLSIALQRINGELNEVVVTALGIKKEQRSLGYSVTELGSGELMKNKNT